MLDRTTVSARHRVRAAPAGAPTLPTPAHFPSIKGAPALTVAEFEGINAVLNMKTSKIVGEIARDHRVWMSRVLINRLKPSQFVVLSAIVSRTFGWGKIIERIPLRHFRDGIRDANEKPKLDGYGIPIFEGTGLDVVTIRKALSDLQVRSLIARFALQGERSEVAAFLPMSCAMLMCSLIKGSDRKYEAFNELPGFIEATTYARGDLTEDEKEWCGRYIPEIRQDD